MAPNTPTGVPTQVYAGDTWIWKISDLTKYPQSEGWQLLYEIAGEGKLSLTASEVVWQSSGDDANSWLVTVPLASTEALSAGLYQFTGRMVGSGAYSGREDTISTDEVVVLPDPRAAVAGEFRTDEEQILDAINAEIRRRTGASATGSPSATGGFLDSYSLVGQNFQKMPMTELMRMRRDYTSMVNEQRRRRLKRFGRRVQAVMP